MNAGRVGDMTFRLRGGRLIATEREARPRSSLEKQRDRFDDRSPGPAADEAEGLERDVEDDPQPLSVHARDVVCGRRLLQGVVECLGEERDRHAIAIRAVRRRIGELCRRSRTETGKRNWTREDLHAR